MSNDRDDSTPCQAKPRHLRITSPSPWVMRWMPLIRPNGTVLDLAAGGGRHGRLCLNQGHSVTFVDKNIKALNDIKANHTNGNKKVTIIATDLESGAPWPLANQTFDAVIVVNYLHRPLFPDLLSSLKPSGVLIYETFAQGNEKYCRPRNPAHLLRPQELLDLVTGTLTIVAYEHGFIKTGDIPGVKQRLCAVNNLGTQSDAPPILQDIYKNI